MNLHTKLSEGGQLLAEVILAAAIAFFFIVGAAGVVAVSLSASKSSTNRTKAQQLMQEGIEALEVIRNQNWVTGFEDQSCATGSACKIQIASGKWSIASGSETITLDGIAYTRVVAIDPVSRDVNGSVATSGTVFTDPLSKKVAITVTWDAGAANQSVSTVRYLTRYRNSDTAQTDWSGGPGQCGAFVVTNMYCISANEIHLDHGTANQVTLK